MGILYYLKYLKFTGRLISNRGKTPLYMIFFVTSRCNMRCKHCFFWKELNKTRDELTIDEIGKIAKSLDPLMLLRLTGGEPTLRDDLPDIIELFYKNNGVRNIGISTNGFMTDKLCRDVETALKRCRDMYLEVCVSLDDYPDEHDRNRMVKGAYKRAVESIKRLKEIKKKFSNLNVVSTITVTNDNQDRVNDVFDRVLVPLKLDSIYVNMIRGEPQNPDSKDVSLKRYESIIDRARRYNKRTSHKLYVDHDIKDKIVSDLIIRTIREKRFQGLYCIAGDKAGVIFSNGDVYPCEMLDKKMGSIRDYRYNFRRLWNSKKSRKLRKFIRDTKCFCTHECFLTSNLLLSPKNAIKHFIKYLTK